MGTAGDKVQIDQIETRDDERQIQKHKQKQKLKVFSRAFSPELDAQWGNEPAIESVPLAFTCISLWPSLQVNV